MQEVATAAEWNALVRGTRVVYVVFSAPWCGPCKVIKPRLATMATQLAHTGLSTRVVTVDIDNKELEYVVSSQGISSIPCMCVIQDGEFLPGRVVGSDLAKMQSICNAEVVKAMLQQPTKTNSKSSK